MKYITFVYIFLWSLNLLLKPNNLVLSFEWLSLLALRCLQDKLEEAIVKLTTHQLSLSENFQTMTLKLDELITNLATPKSPAPSPSFSTAIPSSSLSLPSHHMKLDVPRFDKIDPLGWIFKITQFFEYHNTPDHEKLTIASFYIDGRTLSWFQWMTSNGQLTSWPIFL